MEVTEQVPMAMTSNERIVDVVFSATFTIDPIEEPFRFLADRLGMSVSVTLAPYNQVFQQLLDPSSALMKNADGINVVLVRLEDWVNESSSADLTRKADEWITALTNAASRSTASFIVGVTPLTAEERDKLRPVRTALLSRLGVLNNVFSLDLSDAAVLYEVAEYYDPYTDRLGAIPFTDEFYAAMAAAVVRTVRVLRDKPYKVIAVDCDNTLWRGVVGEDGPDGIEIDGGFRALQRFLVQQHDAGMLICLCSKNNEADVVEVFEQHPDMPLKITHIAAHRINWATKSDNLLGLARDLQLGADSIIFLDDNPLEVAEVQTRCPEVLAFSLAEPPEMEQFLNHIWAFDHGTRTEDDGRRTRYYQEDARRQQMRAAAPSLDEFLQSLNLEIAFHPMEAHQVERVSDLTNRTNQFNATTIRRSAADILQLGNENPQECWVVEVRDRFGSYGLVGVVIFDICGAVLRVDTLLMSCRVLGRRVEDTVVRRLAELAETGGAETVRLPFRPTKKNAPVLQFYQRFQSPLPLTPDGSFVLDIDTAAILAGTLPINGDVGVKQTDVVAVDGALSDPGSAIQVAARFQEIATLYSRADAIVEASSPQLRSRPSVGRYVSPRTTEERRMAELWAGVLSVDRVGLHDDFFELGGESLLAVRLLDRVRTEWSRELPITALYRGSTVQRMVQLLNEDEESESDSIVCVQQGSPNRLPFFFLHGDLYGGGFYSRSIARYLDPGQPLFSVQPYGVEHWELPETIEAVAAHHAAALQAAQPNGPYFIGGFCNGGVVAYEVARQLEQQGKQVGLLALIYARPVNAGYPTIDRMVRRILNTEHLSAEFKATTSLRVQYYLSRLDYFKQLQHSEKARILANKLIGMGWRMWTRRHARGNQASERFSPPPSELRLRVVMETYWRAMARYRPKDFSGNVTLFWPREDPVQDTADPTMGWKEVACAVDVQLVPGTHTTATTQHVQVLAAQLQSALDRAYSAHNGEEASFRPGAAPALRS